MKFFDFKKNVLLNIYLFILLPMIVILPLSIMSTLYFKNFHINSLKNQYTVKLESVCNGNEMALQSIAKSIRFLENDEAFLRVMRGEGSEADIKHGIQQIKQLNTNFPLVYSAVILARNINKTYTIDGEFDSADFFEQRYQYTDYTMNYWLSYKAPLSEKQILPPSLVKSQDDQKNVIPMVFTRIGNEYTSNLLIINISMPVVLGNINDSNSPGSRGVFIVNKQTQEWFDQDGSVDRIVGRDFWEKIAFKGTASLNDEIDGTKSFIIAYSPTNSILGYTYVATLPESEITNQVHAVLLYIAAIWIVIFLVIFVLTRFSAKIIYAPIKNLFNLIPSEIRSGGNEFSTLHLFMQNARETIITFLPMIQERLLVDFLNETAPDIEKTEDAFKKNGLEFSHECFCSVILRMRPTARYYREFENIQQDKMIEKIMDVACSLFPTDYDIYSLPVKNHTLYLLLNFDAEVRKYEIDTIFKEFIKNFEPDKSLIHFKIAVGGIYPGLAGIRLSHDDAKHEIEGVALPPDTKKESFFIQGKRKKQAFHVADEAELSNYLYAGKIEVAREFINNIVKNEQDAHVSNTVALGMYIRIANVVLNVMRTKKLNYKGESVDTLVSEIFQLPPEEVREAVEGMLDVIEDSITEVSGLDIEKIIEYVQEHYSEELNLALLADKYKTSSSYLSRMLKEKLGVNFVDYLSGLRVNKAKQLLKATNQSIEEICMESGFGNRRTFDRVFKNSTNMSPAQFRKQI